MGILTALAVAGGALSLTAESYIQIARQDIRIADVIDAKNMDKATFDLVGEKVIATIPDSVPFREFSRSALANLIRRRVPNFSDTDLRDEIGSVRIERTSGNSQLPASEVCKKTVRTVSKGAVLVKADLVSALCKGAATSRNLYYDRLSGVLRTKEALLVNTYLGAIKVPENRFADVGEELVLKITIGAVQIEKPVWALQSTNDAKHIFVKDADGKLMRVPIQQVDQSDGN